jgi:hypothetical protein
MAGGYRAVSADCDRRGAVVYFGSCRRARNRGSSGWKSASIAFEKSVARLERTANIVLATQVPGFLAVIATILATQ